MLILSLATAVETSKQLIADQSARMPGKPSELREEIYAIKLPEDLKGRITVLATLNYLPYPSPFSRRLGMPKPEKYQISSASKEVDVR